MDHTPEEFQQLKDQHSEMKIQLQFALLEKTELQNKINDDQQQLEIKKKACIKSSDDYKSLSSENKKLKERTVELESDLRKEKSTSKNIREGLHKERIRLTNKLLEAESKNTEYEQKCEQLRSENHQLRSTQANMIALLQQNCQVDQRSTTDVQWAERRQ